MVKGRCGVSLSLMGVTQDWRSLLVNPTRLLVENRALQLQRPFFAGLYWLNPSKV